jgi:flagellar export protein FliJ
VAFRLLRLLHLYRRQEEHCLLLFQAALAKRREAEELVRQYQQKLAPAAPPLGYADGEQLRKTWAYRGFIAQQLTLAREQLVAVTHEAEQARAELLAAGRRRKTLEHLQERYAAQVRREQARKEQALLDEAGLRSYWADM